MQTNVLIVKRGDKMLEQSQIICGDALGTIRRMRDQQFAAIIADPPYASGGATAAERANGTAFKYTNTKRRCKMPDFEGDALDQRSWTRWMSDILRAARDASKPGAVLCLFIDWRQLPSLTDAVQWAGWTWRGIAVWDKLNSRPQKGRFRQQTEYIVWGSNGHMPMDRPVPVLPGVFTVKPPTQAERYHQTEKPLELMRQLVRICEPGGLILDPFCGSGTTLLAARMEGYRSIGIELSEHYAQVALDRIEHMSGQEAQENGKRVLPGC